MSDRRKKIKRFLPFIITGGIFLILGGAAVFIFNIVTEASRKPVTGFLNFENTGVDHPDVAGKQVLERIELLEPKKAFNFTLINWDRRQVSLEDFRGKLVLVGFIYTNCPDVCGLLTQHFKYIQRRFDKLISEDLELVFITTDPVRDNPERIAAYTKGFEGRWSFLTGTEKELQEVWDAYKVFVKEGRAGTDLVYHTYMVALIDREGMIHYRYVGLVDPEETIIKDIQYLLNKG
ncbi:MAG: SCO family protein [Spirochaetota bacterium]